MGSSEALNNHAADAADHVASDPAVDEPACNRAVVLGQLATEPVWRTLPGGSELVSFGLTVRVEGRQTTSVPFAWVDPPQRVGRWKAGDRVIATGAVVRRFFRTPAGTASRTEVAVDRADLATRPAAVERIVTRAIAEIEACRPDG